MFTQKNSIKTNKERISAAQSISQACVFITQIASWRPKSNWHCAIFIDVTFRRSTRLKTPVAVTAKRVFKTSKPRYCNNYYFTCSTRFRPTYTVCTFTPLSCCTTIPASDSACRRNSHSTQHSSTGQVAYTARRVATTNCNPSFLVCLQNNFQSIFM